MEKDILAELERRLGRLHARQRLGIEADHEQRAFGDGLNFVHIENWNSAPVLIRTVLRLTGLYGRGQRNAARIAVRENPIRRANLLVTIVHVAMLATFALAALRVPAP